MSVEVKLTGVTKRIGSITAVDQLSLSIKPSDLLFILGPSGCGKTTTLRMLAGLSDPSEGRIHFDGRDVTDLTPRKRNVGMVFQNYALWPHMTVEDNVEFGLRMRKLPRKERRERVAGVLSQVGLGEYGKRKPGQLSGGQQQRVALARALVVHPDVLLLDEPLSNLDANLRVQMRELIRDLCKTNNLTALYVTHDQEEAMSIADQVAILRDGQLEQIGPPDEVYAKPRSEFVARFLGETNILKGDVASIADGRVELKTSAGVIASTNHSGSPTVGEQVSYSIRPESAHLRAALPEECSLSGRIVETKRRGHWLRRRIEFGGGASIIVQEALGSERNDGDKVNVAIHPHDVSILGVGANGTGHT